MRFVIAHKRDWEQPSEGLIGYAYSLLSRIGTVDLGALKDQCSVEVNEQQALLIYLESLVDVYD